MKIDAKVLQPAFYRDFACNQAQCTHTCCQGRKIFVDKKSFKKYRAVKSQNYCKKISANPTAKGSADYGLMQLDADGNCGFLENGLCLLYKNEGRDALCHSCRDYPAITNLAGDTVLRSMDLSCEAVCKLLFKNETPLRFELLEEPLIKMPAFVGILSLDDPLVPLKAHFLTLRSLFIDLLQNRNYALNDRLILIGMALETVTKLTSEKNFEKINLYCEKFKNATEDRSLGTVQK